MYEKGDFSVRIFAPAIESSVRHEKIFAAFDLLRPGQVLELTNDHNPKPLQYQFAMEREGQFSWEYLQRGPETWRVAIGKEK
ncbi:DUF2249 domain-containing protein [Virgibacillus halophilus]|uniref:DUF2249 domain-containing protein n=1 Tax=Tigheibacillus halophilus TaxID=361280 RepID=A0ABU5CBX6_9BACI|nr:DUF2249 domain-containing protein [Virgibacillus halophilus]